ncbi:hypothetical protein VTH82DRAFT_1779 [Thermothelomyces myriococcoides]
MVAVCSLVVNVAEAAAHSFTDDLYIRNDSYYNKSVVDNVLSIRENNYSNYNTDIHAIIYGDCNRFQGRGR